MKRILMTFAIALCTITAALAQDLEPQDFPLQTPDGKPVKFNKEQFMQIQCNVMADNLALIGQKREDFIKIYSEFTKETNEIAKTRIRPDGCKTEDDVEKAILQNFEVSEKILEVRKNYYSKFKTILTPSQIQLMYRSEFSRGHHNHDAPGAMPPPSPRPQ